MDVLQSVKNLFANNTIIGLLFAMLMAYYPIFLFSKKLLSSAFDKILKGRIDYKDLYEKHNVGLYLKHIFFALYLVFCITILEKHSFILFDITYLRKTILTIYLTIFITLSIASQINVALDVYNRSDISKKIPIGLYLKTVKTVLMICAIMIIISTLLNQSIGALFASIGATFAVTSFIFKDAIAGFLSAIQLTYQDIIRVGDTISIPGKNIDGTVEEISVSIIKVRNFDKTVTSIPTMSIASLPITNLRGMHESKGRRIKRSINLDIHKVKIYNKEELDDISSNPLIAEFKKEKPELFILSNNIVNITLFRKYLHYYLSKNNALYHENSGFAFMVRQLAPGSSGIPLELYTFANNTDWVFYEELQADIFDHILAILPIFKLRVFQSIL